MTYILSIPSPSAQEQLSKFINTMASDCSGREYLLSNQSTIVVPLLNAVRNEKMDTLFRQHLLGALQKLSLRRVSQSIMNQNAWVAYLLDLFEDLEGLSEYTIEYGAALLMNLCLRTLGKKACLADPARTLRILNELLEHDNLQVFHTWFQKIHNQ